MYTIGYGLKSPKLKKSPIVEDYAQTRQFLSDPPKTPAIHPEVVLANFLETDRLFGRSP
jgi:hypothetical protein